MFSLFTSSPPHLPTHPVSFLLSYLYHTVSSINLPSCVSEGVGGGPHSVSHSSSINDQLEHGATQSPPLHLTPPLLLTHTRTLSHTHTISIIFASFEDKSAFFYLFPFAFSLSLYLSPSQWIYLPRLITRSPNQRCMASSVMSVREKEQERVRERA